MHRDKQQICAMNTKHETCIDMHKTIKGSRNQWKIPMKFSKTNKHVLGTN